MTDRTENARSLDAALNRLYQNWDEQVSAPRINFLAFREQLGAQERPSPLSQLAGLIGRVTAKWKLPVSKTTIGQIAAGTAIAVLVALYLALLGPGAKDADYFVHEIEDEQQKRNPPNRMLGDIPQPVGER